MSAAEHPVMERLPLRVIAIDGPAGSGKSTVARAVAARLGLPYLDTGAMYRAVTLAALRAGLDPGDAEPVGRLAEEIVLDVADGQVRIDGDDATAAIRSVEVTRAVSVVSANSRVRTEMRRRQREWAEVRGGGVMEGRDIGTVVFPDASAKVYLTASAQERARRRHGEVEAQTLESIAADIARRDALDSGRADSPLVAAGDAVVIDTTGLSIDEVVDRVVTRL